MSSGRPSRPSGELAAISSPDASMIAAIIFVRNGPGAIALTVIRRGPSFFASTRVIWCTPALLAV